VNLGLSEDRRSSDLQKRMETLGIILSVPVAFIASLVYCFLLTRLVVRFETLRRFMWRVSAGVLMALVCEIVLLIALGAVRARGSLGPGFYVAHLLLFFLGTPALANVLLLRDRPNRRIRWYLAVPLCTAFAFGLVLLQYGVSEALHGVDGVGGPFNSQEARSRISDRVDPRSIHPWHQPNLDRACRTPSSSGNP
jgi:hypothetical protein